jgi:hypothetical protein
MDKEVNARGTSTRRRQKVTNMHFYHVEFFFSTMLRFFLLLLMPFCLR